MSDNSYEKFYKDLIESSKKFMAAWQEQIEKNPPQTPSLPIGFFKEAEGLFEKMMWFPPFSMIEGTATPLLEQQKIYWELVVSYLELYQEWLSVYLEFSRIVMTTIFTTNAKLMSVSTIGQPNEAYTKWIEGMENGIDKLLRDQTFAEKLGHVLSKMLDVRKKSDEFMESYLSMMNIPTRSEMKRVHREMYFLKKKIRELSAVQKKGSGPNSPAEKRGANGTS